MGPETPLVVWFLAGFCLGTGTYLLNVLGASVTRKPGRLRYDNLYPKLGTYLQCCSLLGPALAFVWFTIYPGARVGLGIGLPCGLAAAVVGWRRRDQLPRVIGLQARPDWRKSKSERELERIADDSFCHLETTGRVSGQSHDVQTFFAVSGRSLYLLSIYKDQAHWVRNVLKQPRVSVLISKRRFAGVGRVVTDPEEQLRARHLLATKYRNFESDGTLGQWAREGLPVAVDIDGLAPK